MSHKNSWNTRKPAILSVLFPIFFIMSDESNPVVDPAAETETTTTEAPAAEEVTTETEAPADADATAE